MEVEQTAPANAEEKGKGKAVPSKRFEIKKWNAVAMWSWAICTDTCAICRNNLYEPSIEYQVCIMLFPCDTATACVFRPDHCSPVVMRAEVCRYASGQVAHWLGVTCDGFLSICMQANPTGDPDHPGLSIAWGACGHVFHLDCIQRWLKTRSACPLCNKEWDFLKIEKILPGGSMQVD